LAIVPAARNITETAAGDNPTVTGATAMTLFVRQPKNLCRQLVGSKPRNDRGFSWFWEEVVQA